MLKVMAFSTIELLKWISGKRNEQTVLTKQKEIIGTHLSSRVVNLYFWGDPLHENRSPSVNGSLETWVFERVRKIKWESKKWEGREGN
jgi:hypothetical protein